MAIRVFGPEFFWVFYVKLFRCECGTCQPMQTIDESVCCMEIKQVWQIVEDQPETEMKCITEHPGFQSTCLDVWVVETACYAYRQQQYGTDNKRGNE